MVSDTEIRVTVPQTAQPGLVVLKTPKGDITTKTELTFTEPIALEAFAPAEVKPGSELTITGEYLNLIKEVIFADEVTVPADEFVSQSRQEIKVMFLILLRPVSSSCLMELKSPIGFILKGNWRLLCHR